jgi:hypothetical protein
MNNEIQKEVTTKGDNVISAFFRAETLSSKENNQILRQMNAKESLPKHVLPELVLCEDLPKQGESQLSSPSKSAVDDKTQDKASSKPTDMGCIVRRDARGSMSGTLPKDSTVSNPGTVPNDSTVSKPHPRLPEPRMPQWGPSNDTTGINEPKPVEIYVPKVSAIDKILSAIPYTAAMLKTQIGESEPKY